MTLPLITGDNDPTKQVSKDAWNNLISEVNDLGTAVSDLGDTTARLPRTSAISAVATAAANLATLNAEIAAVAVTGGVLVIPPNVYPLTGQIVCKSNVTLLADGVELTGAWPYLYCAAAIDNFHVRGLTITATSATCQYMFRFFYMTNWSMRNVTFRRTDGTGGGYIGMLFGGGYGLIDGMIASGTNGIWCEQHDLNIVNSKFTAGPGGDDCLVIKAGYNSAGDPRTSAYNITINNISTTGYAAAVSLGSEIGTYAANDATYSRYISNVTISNVTALNCAYLTFIKPGANAGNDFRDGTVENVTISNCSLTDYSGTKFKIGIHILAGRGARVRDIKISNITIRARAQDQATTNAGVVIYPYDYTGGTAATLIEDIRLSNVTITDHYSGASNSGGTPGYPIDYAVFIDKSTTSGGTLGVVGRIELDRITLNGSRRSAVAIGSGLTGPFVFRRPIFRNFCHTGVAGIDRCAFNVSTVVDVKDGEFSPSASAPAGSRPVMADGATNKAIEIVGESEHTFFGSVSAGSSLAQPVFIADRPMWLRKVEVVTDNSVAQSDTNYLTFTLRTGSGGSTNILGTYTTKVTGGFGAITNFVPVAINGSSQLSGANSLLVKGGVVYLSIISTGTATFSKGSVILHFVPYGSA